MIIKQPTVYALAGFTGFTGGDDVYPLIYYKATDDLFQTMEAIKTPIEALLTRIVATRGTSELQPYLATGKPLLLVAGITFADKGIMYCGGPLG